MIAPKDTSVRFGIVPIIILILLSLAIESCSTFISCLFKSQKVESRLIIDVRTDKEFDSGHLQGAINTSYQVIGENIADLTCCKNQEIILYCRSGRRSEIAKTTLLELGYTNVTNAGGYEEIKATGIYD
ncbi:MAG: rhodanese-like domain-containing protein [Candidatus Marinimicrobia bacterium]|nr:rhodanese-like domain-containing protein [Candidatus Neomarinimicrobiota bacterium]